MRHSRFRTIGTFCLNSVWVFFFPCILVTLRAEAAETSLKKNWDVQSPHLFHSALDEGFGFSFSYDGKPIGPATLPDWKITTRTLGRSRETTFRHPTGLTVIRHLELHAEFEAVEYTLRFRNESSNTLAAISQIDALDLKFEREFSKLSVVSSGGGLDDSTYPPRTFALHTQRIGPMTPVNGQVALTTEGGRSSNRDLPFYFVQDEYTHQGIFVAVGWSGQWKASVYGNFHERSLQFTAGIPDIHIQLKPGEEISGPRILLGCYHGPLSSGSNRLRRLIRDIYSPLLDGKRVEPVLTYDHWWNIGHQFDETLLRRLADAAAQIGQEYFLLDAGWYAGTNDAGGFSAGVGNWDEIDNTKFPSGMGAFADYVRSKGLKFGLWFEPERVAKGSLLASQHPDWVIWLPQNAVQPPANGTPTYGLLDYGRLEVQEWVFEMLDRYIRQLDIRYIRYDFNLDPLAYWLSQDTPDRRGISQIHHIEGFYRVIDRIRQQHPKTVLEGCASGGRRIDLETTRRFHTFWISDHTVDPHIVRFHLQGLNYFLPGNYSYVCYTLPLPYQQNFRTADLGFQSFFGGAFGTGGRIDDWSREMKEQAKKHVTVYKSLRRFLMEDYYSLTPQPLDLDSWTAWQFHKPETNEGFVQVFRLESSLQSRSFALKGLTPTAKYRFTEPYSGKTFQLKGSEALSNGVTVELPKLSSRVLLYQQLSEAKR